MSKTLESRILVQSNGKKLQPYFSDILKRKGPFHLEIMPTNKCNLKCEFCGLHGKHDDTETPLKTIIETLDILPDLRSIEITGGGEPTLSPIINDIITICYHRGLKLGLVTNGTALDNIKGNIVLFNWIRISINGMVDKGMKVNFDIVPSETKLGISYVVHKDSPKDYIERLRILMRKYRNIRYCRITEDIYECKEENLYMDYGDGIFMIRRPWSKSSKKCYLGSTKCILAPNGLLFPCCVMAINEHSYDPKYATNADDLKNYKPYSCPYEKCPYAETNEYLEYILSYKDNDIDFI